MGSYSSETRGTTKKERIRECCSKETGMVLKLKMNWAHIQEFIP